MKNGIFLAAILVSVILNSRASPPPTPPAAPVPVREAADPIEVLEAALKDNPRDPHARYRLARALHLKGVDEDEESAERALGMLEKLAAEEAENPLVIAYFGSAKILKAKRALLPWQKGKLSNSGLELLDRAVELAPGDLEVRFVRGISSYPLPFFFGRGEQAAEDFDFVAGKADEAVASGKIDPAIAAGAFYYRGLCLDDDDRIDEARGAWAKATAIAPGSPFARAAAAKLESDDR